MSIKTTDLDSYKNHDFKVGAGKIKRIMWFLVNATLIKASWNPSSALRIFLLKLFGATIGSNAVLRPGINIKFPWKLKLGNNVWIGENVWIDNLARVTIGDNCCISQGALLICGNHNFQKTTFDLITQEIKLENGVWIGAKAVVCPGVIANSHSVLCVGSVASANLLAYGIYRGNPSIFIKERLIKE
jgi:putative colanic acid biosynthesis acetyltransferase WcaF